MTRFFPTLAAAAAVAAALSVPAQAQPELETLAGADLDGDGVITCQEARDFRETLFWAQDHNQDRSVDRTEFRNALPERAPWIAARLAFSRLDANSDGRIASDELAAAPLARFQAADVDDDCRLTQAELNAALTAEGGR